MGSYVPKLHVLFLFNSLSQLFCSQFFLYIELLQHHLVRWSSLDNSLQLQALTFFHIELYLRCIGSFGSASNKLIFCRLLKHKYLLKTAARSKLVGYRYSGKTKNNASSLWHP